MIVIIIIVTATYIIIIYMTVYEDNYDQRYYQWFVCFPESQCKLKPE